MNLFNHRIFMGCLLVLCIFSGCKRRRPRKMLPDYDTGVASLYDDIFQSEKLNCNSNEFPIYTSDTIIRVNSKNQKYLNVTVPDPLFDGLAITILRSGESLHAMFWDELDKEGEKGILIDLRRPNELEKEKIEMLLKDLQKHEALGLVILFSQSSANRAEKLIDEVGQMPGIAYTIQTGATKIHLTKNAIGLFGTGLCFQTERPSIDDN